MAKPGMVAVAAGLLGLMCAGQPVGAEEQPASAAPSTLSVTEVLQRWTVGTARLSARGRLRYQGTAQLDESSQLEQAVRCYLDWDGTADFQIGMDRSEVPNDSNPLRIPLWNWGLQRVSQTELLLVHFGDDTYASMLRKSDAAFEGSTLGWLLEGRQLKRSQAPLAIAVSLAGPGWIGTPRNWADEWSWAVLKQDSHRVILQGIPQGPDRSVFREVRWLIDSQRWDVVGVRWTDADDLRITKLYRVVSPWPEDLRRALMTAEELEQRGFRNVGSHARELSSPDGPADALLPRNGWDW